MQHLFKTTSLASIIKYNKILLVICASLSISTVLLSFKALYSNERWVLIPASDTDKRLEISSSGYSRVYLKEWAIYVMQTLMTTSYDTVRRQIEDIKIISSRSSDLEEFFRSHLKFIQSSNIESVFFPKKVTPKENHVEVTGLFKYWLGSSKQPVSQTRTYLIGYKRGPNGVLLLKSVEQAS